MRGQDEFFEAGIELANPAPIEDPYLELARKALGQGLTAPAGPIPAVATADDPLSRPVPGIDDIG